VTLADIENGRCATLKCGCVVRRLCRGERPYVCIELLITRCAEDRECKGDIRSEHEQTDVEHPFITLLKDMPPKT